MRRPTPAIAGLVAACLGVSILAAQEPDATPLAQRVEELRAQVVAEPQSPEKLFNPEFLKAVPAAQVHAILKQYHAQGGAVTSSLQVDSKGDHYGEYRFTTAKGMVFPVKLGVDPTPPHRINTLWFGVMQPGAKDAAEILKKIEALSGEVSFAFWRLGGEKPQPVHQIEPDRALAIGSAFKLYILGALVAAAEKEELGWESVARLREEWKSWPSGILHTWPAGAPLTLHSLASAMISVSDNTATDHLLFEIGREKVESVQKVMGHSKPERNVPFLATREMFRIKELGKAEERVAAYLALDPAGRRAWLDNEAAALGREEFAGIDQLRPTAIDTVEWFASAADLCRAMDWLRVKSDSGKGAAARGVMSINPGLEFRPDQWSYVGYKGGSEPGVLNMTWLLERQDGAWFALSAGWNDPDAALDQQVFFGLLQGFIDKVGD